MSTIMTYYCLDSYSVHRNSTIQSALYLLTILVLIVTLPNIGGSGQLNTFPILVSFICWSQNVKSNMLLLGTYWIDLLQTQHLSDEKSFKNKVNQYNGYFLPFVFTFVLFNLNFCFLFWKMLPLIVYFYFHNTFNYFLFGGPI